MPIYLSLVVLSLLLPGLLSSCGEQGLFSSCGEQGLLSSSGEQGLFSSSSEPGLLSSCGVQASHCSGFSCCRARARGHSAVSSCGTRAQ